MGWDGIELKDGQSELDCILEEITSSGKLECIAHSYRKNEGVYYFALKEISTGLVFAEIASMNSYMGEREDGWIYFKMIHEGAVPIYIQPSKKVFKALTYMGENFNYQWRAEVKSVMGY